LTKRNEDGVHPFVGELEPFDAASAASLADVRVTRSQAIKLAGLGVAGFLFTLILPDEADALNRRKRRRRRRRRMRQRAITSNPSTVNFGDVTIGTPLTEGVTITNNGTTPVTLRPEVVGDGFTLVDASNFTLDPGESDVVDVVFTPDVGGVSTGTLRLIDVRDGLVVESVDLLGEGVSVTPP
jgi:hypothetical protein